MKTKKQKQPPAPAPAGRMMYSQNTLFPAKLESLTLWADKDSNDTPVLVLDLSDEARVVECMARTKCEHQGWNWLWK